MNRFNRHPALFWAVGLLALFLVFQVVTLTETFVGRVETRAEAKEAVFLDVLSLSARLRDARGTGAGKRGKTDIASLLPWLEKETARGHMASHVREIAPVALQGSDSGLFREKATLGVADISMERALRFLHQLESAPEIRIVRGDLRRSEKESAGVTLSMEIGLL